MEYLVLLILASYHPPKVIYAMADTGMGRCAMDQHYHNSDRECHRDSDDSPVKILYYDWAK